MCPPQKITGKSTGCDPTHLRPSISGPPAGFDASFVAHEGEWIIAIPTRCMHAYSLIHLSIDPFVYLSIYLLIYVYIYTYIQVDQSWLYTYQQQHNPWGLASAKLRVSEAPWTAKPRSHGTTWGFP